MCNRVYYQWGGETKKTKKEIKKEKKKTQRYQNTYKKRKMQKPHDTREKNKQEPHIPPIDLGIIITNYNQLQLYFSAILIIILSPQLVWESGRRHAQTSTLLLACTNVIVQVFK